jgi:hypothetical protein
MFRDFSRAQQRFLGLYGPLRSRADAESASIVSLLFTPPVRRVLQAQLYATGQLRGGPLFGSFLDGEATVVAAPLSGYLSLVPSLRGDPLHCDERYVLGWSDAVRFCFGEQVDWVGQWMMTPDSQLGLPETHLPWIRQGMKTDLVNGDRVLCCVGWSEGQLGAAAYTCDQEWAMVGAVKTDL